MRVVIHWRPKLWRAWDIYHARRAAVTGISLGPLQILIAWRGFAP